LFSRDFKIRIIEGITNPDLIVHIGTSGWSYDPWEGVLYPHQLPSRQELDCYTQHYQTVVFNSTYYRWPPNATFAFLAIAPPPRISDDRNSVPWSLRTRPHLYSPIADRIHESESQGRPVFVYFNNDGEGNAVRNASGLKTFVENGTS
jgi:uncharacterized protein YecE (DUF72 family)